MTINCTFCYKNKPPLYGIKWTDNNWYTYCEFHYHMLLDYFSDSILSIDQDEYSIWLIHGV